MVLPQLPLAERRVQSLNMVDNWISLSNPFSGSFFIMGQSRQATFPGRRLYPSTSAHTYIGLSMG